MESNGFTFIKECSAPISLFNEYANDKSAMLVNLCNTIRRKRKKYNLCHFRSSFIFVRLFGHKLFHVVENIDMVHDSVPSEFDELVMHVVHVDEQCDADFHEGR